MSRKVKVLLAGAAFAADLHADAYSRIRDKAEIVAIVDKNIERVKELALRYGFTGYVPYSDIDEALEKTECDVVDICLPNFLHASVAIKALEKGFHVICEKPLATKVEDAVKIIETAERMGKKVYYAEDWLGSPALNKALELIEKGGIGELKFIRARECHSGSHSPFAQTIEYCGGGAMMHLGIHPVGFVLALKNNRWESLTALTSGGLEKNLMHKGMEGEDWSAALIRFEDGTTAVLEANFVTRGGMEDYIDFYGDQGCLHVDLTFSSALRGFSIPGFDYTVEKAELTTGWSRPAVDERYNLGYVSEIAHFVDCIQKNCDAKVGLRGIDGLEAVKVIHLIYKSAREGIHIKNEALGVR
ncbi:MAG TPA: Gfo/Idh/MocA family oxidoreductase [Thermoclostridium caenicola]|uniref:Predicted dehydrogenase n=1 Tax=Thermoclostridium caenicola TaxID=659425 RepID=A0A1M6G421_9FIRM|nr:Gfo/Idh/MocA family oxidoreductase [Thermoclostridium caenicola]SHJ04567.1 Predicted dehydrogenase [Thermoclostridium caenicola]HOK43602.1 Gfo/Idh/MocA family oxidoreductase [Thermoclostridium caenicola]HOL83786.1 Gfo/Idh/MocA family oxidoreductase [Thermoclostridium caenicola]HPO75808.1 Gfo/Idh/MocA family oxidoreductase [Thermoclostridium caenicola]